MCSTPSRPACSASPSALALGARVRASAAVACVQVATMPSWLRGFGQHNPVSVLADSLRGLFHVTPALTTADTRWALIQSAAWIVGILLVFVPLSVIRYRRTMAR